MRILKKDKNFKIEFRLSDNEGELVTNTKNVSTIESVHKWRHTLGLDKSNFAMIIWIKAQANAFDRATLKLNYTKSV